MNNDTKEYKILRWEKIAEQSLHSSSLFIKNSSERWMTSLSLRLFFTHFNEVEILIRGRKESWCTVVDRYRRRGREREREREGEGREEERKWRTMWLSLTGKSIERKTFTIQNWRVTVFHKDHEGFGNEEKEMEWVWNISGMVRRRLRCWMDSDDSSLSLFLREISSLSFILISPVPSFYSLLFTLGFEYTYEYARNDSGVVLMVDVDDRSTIRNALITPSFRSTQNDFDRRRMKWRECAKMVKI